MNFWWLLLILFVWTGRMAKNLSTERTRTGKAGEDITIMCNYDKTRFALYDKFWCRGEWRNNCVILCESKWSEQNCHDKRMSINDNRYGKLIITMRNIVVEDGGTYWCGIQKQYGNPMILVNLRIIDVPRVYRIQQDTKQTVKEGENLTIKCLYDKTHLVTYKKYLCQQVSSTQCNMLADTKGFLLEKYSERIQIVDDNSGTVSFTIKTILFEDTGKYTCGIEVQKLHSLASFEIIVELEPISLPVVSFINSPEGSCLGLPVVIACESSEGHQLQYSWYNRKNQTVSCSKRLEIQCESLPQNEEYRCEAANRWQKKSVLVRVLLQQFTRDTCSYQVLAQDQQYNCSFITLVSTANIATTNAAAVIPEITTQCLSEVIASNFYNKWNLGRWIVFLLMCSALLLRCLFLKRNSGAKPRRDASFPLMP
ncbi:polymeric immunoglobulin receptor-like [Ranitomeya imitator]|uniref:polymeric immunoglobulin receptor-like n=1 Tax=Ranitomeya imitator TaxID=111125 RepID=UPI0037E80F1C